MPAQAHSAFALRCNVDVVDLALCDRYRKALYVKDDGLSNFDFHFGDSSSSGHAAWQIRHVCRVVTLSLFNDNRVSHIASLLQTSLLENAVQSAWCEVVAGFARNSNATMLARVLELPMTDACCDQGPAVSLEHAEDLGNLHYYRIAGAQCAPDPPNRVRLQAGE